MKKTKVKIDLCAYTNKHSKLLTSVEVNFNQDEKIMIANAINLGKKFWHNYNNALINHICVDFIHYDE
jgi:transcription termination factor NusB